MDAIRERIEHHGVVVEVAGLEEFDLRVVGRHAVGVVVDALDEHAGEQEVRKDDEAAVTESGRVTQSGLDQREGHPGVADLAPPEPEALPQHAHDLVDVGVGVGVGGAAPDHHQHGVVPRHIVPRPIQRLLDAIPRRFQHLRIDAELACVADLHAGMRNLVSAQYRRDVVLGVAGREQHAGHRQHQVVPRRVQLVQTVADDGRGELQEPALDLVLWQPLSQASGDSVELRDCVLVTAAVTADHDPDLAHSVLSWFRPMPCGLMPQP